MTKRRSGRRKFYLVAAIVVASIILVAVLLLLVACLGRDNFARDWLVASLLRKSCGDESSPSWAGKALVTIDAFPDMCRMYENADEYTTRDDVLSWVHGYALGPASSPQLRREAHDFVRSIMLNPRETPYLRWSAMGVLERMGDRYEPRRQLLVARDDELSVKALGDVGFPMEASSKGLDRLKVECLLFFARLNPVLGRAAARLRTHAVKWFTWVVALDRERSWVASLRAASLTAESPHPVGTAVKEAVEKARQLAEEGKDFDALVGYSLARVLYFVDEGDAGSLFETVESEERRLRAGLSACGPDEFWYRWRGWFQKRYALGEDLVGQLYEDAVTCEAEGRDFAASVYWTAYLMCRPDAEDALERLRGLVRKQGRDPERLEGLFRMDYQDWLKVKRK